LTFESALAPTKRYTYVSNHRDIVLDSALLSIVLIENGFEDTPEIAIGDNLLIYPWIKKLVRVNKSFIVQRSLSMREMLESSRRMSSYMHYAINEKQQSIWIAQREGRAKDSNDRTQESVLKMMAMGGEGTPTERLKSLNIAPLSISYEYDPCDYLKAQEFQQKRDNPDFKKSREDDLKNMQTGIFGYKGQVHYQVAPCINEWIDEMSTLPKGEFFSAVAQRMDADIFRNYRLYPGNYVAADLLESSTRFASHYTEEQKQQFEKYVQSRIALVELPNPDTAYLRERILEMYANPVLNQLSVQQ
ncbi:MAG: 1-acyl-sn-glycerol-3-phosphate acyltransferase, partial [Bacteroidaceae bacterium]|nr:1-acyl-sn-glycerol-3-phosphate acyltransferase [Bacteroidaceae bacterium]